MSETVFCPLSHREMQVLRLIAEGLSAKEIAWELQLSPRTVDIYRNRLMDHSKAKNSISVVVMAMRMGLIQ